MTTWTAFTRKPVTSSKDLELTCTLEGRKPTKVKAQLDSATECAGKVLDDVMEGKLSNVVVSGFAGDDGATQVRISVVEVEEDA